MEELAGLTYEEILLQLEFPVGSLSFPPQYKEQIEKLKNSIPYQPDAWDWRELSNAMQSEYFNAEFLFVLGPALRNGPQRCQGKAMPLSWTKEMRELFASKLTDDELNWAGQQIDKFLGAAGTNSVSMVCLSEILLC